MYYPDIHARVSARSSRAASFYSSLPLAHTSVEIRPGSLTDELLVRRRECKDSTADGTADGAIIVVADDDADGTAEGAADGVADCAEDVAPDGAADGSTDGTADGVAGGADRATDGGAVDSADGGADGGTDGATSDAVVDDDSLTAPKESLRAVFVAAAVLCPAHPKGAYIAARKSASMSMLRTSSKGIDTLCSPSSSSTSSGGVGGVASS